MKKTRCIVALVLALAMVASLFAGCEAAGGSAQPAPEASADKPFAGKTIHILMEDVPDTEYVQSLVPKFTEETGIKVEIESSAIRPCMKSLPRS